MNRIAMALLVVCALAACSGDDEGGAGDGGASGAAGMGGSGGGASGMGGSGGGASGTGGSGGGASGMGGSGGGGAPSGGGQVVAPWDTLCVLEFTADYDVLDFGDVLFTAKSGDRYLMGSTTFAATTILYLTPEGQAEFELEDDAEFTSNCMSSGTDHAAVFADTVVYADEALTMERCMLEAGTHAPGSVGFALAGEDIFTSNTYEMTFTGLESFCDGMSTGFVEGTNITIGNASFGQPAIANVLAP
jgi:hypothetical protein